MALIRAICCATLAGLAVGALPARLHADQPGQDGEGSAAADWTIQTAVDGWNIGPHVSASTDPWTGDRFISYYDDVAKDLWVAHTGGSSPGNCGPSNAWTCLLVDSAGDVGQYNSIAASAMESPNCEIWISYYDATNASLKAARLTYNRLTHQVWDAAIHTIDVGDPGNNLFKGKHTAITLNPTNFPRIAYQVSNLFPTIPEAQMVATDVGTGGNCGVGATAGMYQCDLILNREGIGEYADIEMVDWQTLVLAFYDRHNGWPVVARQVGSGGNCGPAGSWLCRTVEHPTFDTGKYLSLFIEDNGLPHLAYYNETEGSLEYATYVGSGGNCGFWSPSLQWEWQCDWIDDMGSSLTPMGIDMARGADDAPIIAYQDATSPVGPASLKIARPYWSTDWNPVPNCGPIDLMYTWVCEMMDTGGAYLDEADAVAITLDANGDPLIAYRELDSYPYPAEGSIKVAFDSPVVFADGFDSGDLSGWSGTGP